VNRRECITDAFGARLGVIGDASGGAQSGERSGRCITDVVMHQECGRGEQEGKVGGDALRGARSGKQSRTVGDASSSARSG
jgi:hypothetical protein